MGLVTLIVNSRNLEDAIYYILHNQSKVRVYELNEALVWAGKNPKDYRTKDRKIDALIDYLEKEYKC